MYKCFEGKEYIVIHKWEIAIDMLHRGFAMLDYGKNRWVYWDNKYTRNGLTRYPDWEKYVTYEHG